MSIVKIYVGAGGKTTLIIKEMNRLKELGKSVIVTTTTHMGMPSKNKEGTDILLEDVKQIDDMIRTAGIAWFGHPCEDNKFKSPNDDEWDDIIEAADVILIEADGSHRLPVKVPAGYEPVFPPRMDEVNIVMGMRGLDKRIRDICHRHYLALKLLDKTDSDCLTEDDYITIILDGYIRPLQNMYPSVKINIHLTQIETHRQQETSYWIKEKLAQFDFEKLFKFM